MVYRNLFQQGESITWICPASCSQKIRTRNTAHVSEIALAPPGWKSRDFLSSFYVRGQEDEKQSARLHKFWLSYVVWHIKFALISQHLIFGMFEQSLTVFWQAWWSLEPLLSLLASAGSSPINGLPCMYIPEVKKKRKEKGQKGIRSGENWASDKEIPIEGQKKKRFPRDVSSTHVITQTHLITYGAQWGVTVTSTCLISGIKSPSVSCAWTSPCNFLLIFDYN